MSAPERFVEWMAAHRHVDRRHGHVYRYHSRSDAHSIHLCTYILDDLLAACPVLRAQARRGEIVYGINVSHTWANTRKSKTLDLALGRPMTPVHVASPIARSAQLADVLFTCETRSVMTEHGKSQPRVYDELSSSYEIVHQGNPEAIAAGITVVNIADRFASPLRQSSAEQLNFSAHKQPHVAAQMIAHLRGLSARSQIGQVGFDAYCTVVINTDNISGVTLWTDPPAPQPGDRDHYHTFITCIAQLYAERFSTLA